MELADITGLCLVAEGFPREVKPEWISCAFANATGIQVHQLALLNPDVSLGKTAHQAKWLLRFCSHDDQKKCLLHFKRFLIPLKSAGLQITLDFPDISDAAPPLSSWFTAEENQMDSVRTADLFESGHSSSKECPGAGSPQGLLGPGESPPGEASQGAPYMSYPGHGHNYSGPGYQPSMQGQFGHPGGSDPSMQGGRERMMYPQSQEYQRNYPGGDGGQYGYNYAFSPPPQQFGPGIGGYPNMGPAFGEMEQPSGRYANLGTLDSSLMEEDMQSDFVVLEQEGAKHQFHLRVTELPPNVTEQELGEFFQDRRKSGGGPIEQIAFDYSGAAAIYFADREAIDRVMRRAPHLLRGKKIKVDLASENQQSAKVLEIRTVEVRGVENEQMVEMCEYYFESPAKGGGDIEDRRWDEQEKVLYITFVEAAVAKETASRGHKVGGKVLEVTLYEPPSEEDTGPQCTVEVRGFNPALEDLYEMYFENPKKGGGPIKEMTKSEDGTVLLITFESQEVAEHIATLTHQVGGSVLQVTLAPKEKPSSGPPCTVKVTGIAPDIEDMYRMYFEHPKKGGGSIADFKLDAEQQALFVTFEDPEVAQAVCGRSHKVGGRELQVTLHIPQKGPTRQRSREPPAREEEEVPLRTVEVKSVGELQTDDAYLYYFENPRNGGGEVEDVKIDQEKRVVYVTFTEPEVAEAVANRKHKLGGQPIQVQLYVPPKSKPTYPEKLLFQDVAECTTKDCLAMYLERITRLEPKDILYGDEPGVVLVTFPEQPDFAKVQDQCREKKLEKRQLSVSKVPISTCLLVEGLAPTTTEDTVTMYFENSRRSGGGPVEKVEITQDKDMCRGFVYFEDHEVLGQVLEKSHKIDGKTLHVKCYMECLGLSGGSQDPTNFSPPKPIILKDTDKFKIAFIRQSSSTKEDLNQQLAEVNAVAKFQDNTLTIECNLTKDIPKVRILARTWTKDVQHVATEFFTQVDVHRRDVMQQLWQEVHKSVLSSPTPNREEVVMFPLPEEKALVVVGRRDAAKSLFSNISKQVAAIEEEAERKRQEITETNGKLKTHQLRLLIAMAFHAEASKRHPGLRVDINAKKCEITFHGMMHEVKEAQVEMYDLLNNVKTEKITDLSDMQKALLDKKETRQVIVQKFKPDQVVAVWEVGKKEVTIYAFNDDSTVKAVHIIHKSVVHHICELTPESTELLRCPDWQSLIKTLQGRNPGKLLIVSSHDGHQVHVTGTDDIMHGVVEDVENFMQERTVYSEVVRYSPCRQRFITYYWQHKLKQIETALKAYQVKIVLRENEAEMSIRGTSVGLEQLKTRLQQLEGDMVVHTETFSDQAKVKFLNCSPAGKDLEMLGRSCQCVVSLGLEPPGLQIVGPSRGAGLSLSGDVKTSTKVQLPCGVTISVVQGDITQIPADIIVNAANSRMDHIGGLARVIVDKGGKSIQDECYSILKARGGQLNDGDVLVSNGGRLPCKAIIHAVGPMYKGGKSGEEDCLHDTVVKCLETASSASHSSIAIPAICTGIFHYPPAEATLVILDAIKTYLDSHRRVSIKIVYLCHLEADMVQHFCKALRKVFPSAHTQTTPTPKARTDVQKTVKAAPWSASGGGATGVNYQVISVSVLEGEIAKQRADVIVNSTSNGLDLKNGAVSSSILKVGGSSLQDECKTRYPSGIKTEDIAFTNGCGLDCKEVFHLALCNWSNPNAEQLLGLVVTKCLIEASKRHYDTIAFPVLGTGNLGYPRDVVANTMLGAIDKFQQDTPSTSLREARIVVYHTDKQILQDFHQVQSRIGGPVSSSTPQARSSSTRQGRKFSDGGAGLATRSTQAAGAKGVASAEFSIDGLTLVIKQGDITEENVDAIVNSSNSQLDLSRGAVASALRHRGGKQLEAECKLRLVDIRDTGIAVTKGYKIKSKLILHIDAERFADDKGGYARQTGETWETGIKLCLKAAEDNGVSTLALPALGTGGYGMTPSASARVLFDTVTRFCKKRRNLTEIRVVLYDKKMIPQYIGAIQSSAESHNKDNKGIVNWVKGLAGYSAPDVKLTQSSPELEDAKLHIYAGSQNSVKEVLKALEDMVRDRFTRRTLLDDTLMNMSNPEIAEIYQIGRKHNVEVQVQSMTGQVLIDGLHNDVFEAMQKISQFIRTAERQRQEELTADMLLNMVQWCCLEVTTTGNQMVDYAKAQNHVIEMAYQGKKPQAEIVDSGGNVYVIDFSTMKEYPKTDPRDTVSVIRRDKIKDMGSGSLPERWAAHSSNEQIKLVLLLAADPEYQDVEKNLRATLGNRNITVSAISRIQNPTLYRQYAAKKAHLEKQNAGINNEHTLWHGTAADAMDNINMYGFNRSYCGKNATVYGQGVYFAIHSNYSTHPTYSPPDSAGKRYVYQCKVLAGHATLGHQHLRTLTARQGQILFDSATDNLQTPKMYVIFNDTQAYPEYLITFTGT